MTAPIVIGFAGAAGAGKSTLAVAYANAIACARGGAAVILDNFRDNSDEIGVVVKHFALPLKALVAELYGEGPKDQDLGELWQSYGIERKWRHRIYELLHAGFAGPIGLLGSYRRSIAEAMKVLGNYKISRDVPANNNEGVERQVTYRMTRGRMLQLLGTEVMRAIYEDVFVDMGFANCPANGVVVFDDVRFPNEVAAIRKRGGRVYRVHRGERPDDGRDATHASEAYMSLEVDGEIDNTGDVATTLQQLLKLVE
jgi:hypothetical protein